MNVLWCIQALITLAEISGIHILLSIWDVAEHKNRIKKLVSVMGITVLTCLTIYQRNGSMYSRFYLIFCIFIMFLFETFVFQIKKSHLLCVIAIYFETIYSLDLFITIFLGLWGWKPDIALCINSHICPERIGIYLVSRGIGVVLVWLVCRYKKELKLFLTEPGKALYIIPLLKYVNLYFCGVIFYPGREQEGVRNWLVFMILNFLFLIAMMLYYSYSVKRTMQEVMEDEIKLYKEGFMAEQEKSRRKERYYHDMKNHILAMEALLCEKKLDRLQEYMKILADPFTYNGKEIRSGNSVLDYIISDKGKRAGGLEIQIITEISGLSEALKTEQVMDLSAVLGNLWDNAIEGCERLEGKKWISFEMKQQGNIVLINMKNSCLKETKKTGIRTNKSEKDMHGIGMKSIEYIVGKYEGNWQWNCEDDFFAVYITMFLNGGK